MAGKVLTANRVTDGLVVFFTAGQCWSDDIFDALVAEVPQTLERLEEHARRSDAGTEVTDAYLFDVERVAGETRPAHIRERIRSLGPTVRTDLGKQATGTGRPMHHVSL